MNIAKVNIIAMVVFIASMELGLGILADRRNRTNRYDYKDQCMDILSIARTSTDTIIAFGIHPSNSNYSCVYFYKKADGRRYLSGLRDIKRIVK
jgi:hypothetical protein